MLDIHRDNEHNSVHSEMAFIWFLGIQEPYVSPKNPSCKVYISLKKTPSQLVHSQKKTTAGRKQLRYPCSYRIAYLEETMISSCSWVTLFWTEILKKKKNFFFSGTSRQGWGIQASKAKETKQNSVWIRSTYYLMYRWWDTHGFCVPPLNSVMLQSFWVTVFSTMKWEIILEL